MTTSRTLLAGAGAALVLGVLALRLLPDGPAPRPPPAAPVPVRTPARPAFVAPAAPPPVRVVAPPPAPLYGRNGRLVDLQGQDVATYIARRSAAARTGDVRAAYEIYQAASVCAAAADPLPEFAVAAERVQAEAERRRAAALCAGVSAVQLQERMAFLGRAADAGLRDARIDFYTEGPPGAQADDPQVQAWRRQALGYLQQAGAQCDHVALALLANAYDQGELVPRDARMTMAYAMAAAASRHVALTENQLRARFGDELAPADFAAALQAGTQLARRACPAAPK